MGKLLMAAIFVASIGGASVERVSAKGSNLGLPADSGADIARSTFNKRKKGKKEEAASTHNNKRKKK